MLNPHSKEAIKGPGGKGNMSKRRNTAKLVDSETKRTNSKLKGNSYEDHIVKILKIWFPNRNIRRSGVLQSNKAHGVGDIIGWPRVHPEVKDCKSLSVFEWLRKMMEACSQNGDSPVLFFHQPASRGFKNRDEDWMACRAEDFPFLAMDFVEQQALGTETSF